MGENKRGEERKGNIGNQRREGKRKEEEVKDKEERNIVMPLTGNRKGNIGKKGRGVA